MEVEEGIESSEDRNFLNMAYVEEKWVGPSSAITQK
jgi:hypothetical protein